jgi:hypothetical protein
MLTTITLKLIISSLLLALLFIAGIFLHRAGKPYPGLLFNLHKLSAVAMLVLLVISVVQLTRQNYPGLIYYLSLGILALASLGLLVSGGLMSLDKLHTSMRIIHRWTTGLFLVPYVLLLYLAISITYHKIQN